MEFNPNLVDDLYTNIEEVIDILTRIDDRLEGIEADLAKIRENKEEKTSQ
jgi:hypothetical protein